MLLFLSFSFGLIVALTYLGFARLAKPSKVILLLLAAWVIIQSLIALSGFYQNTELLPPRFILVLAPPIITLFLVFLTRKGKRFLESINFQKLTLLHIIRIPVELILLGLFTQSLIPELMILTGRNFDILAGLTAPFIYYFDFRKEKISHTFLIFWNIVSLGLLLNIIINAILSAPFPFQQFAFEQPNLALLRFPFLLLPAFVVPIVLFVHLGALRQLFKTK